MAARCLYRASPDEASVWTDDGGETHSCWLGDGEREAPGNPSLARLARKMYELAVPLSPREVYLYVTQGNYELDALGRDPTCLLASPAPLFFIPPHSDPCDPRLSTAGLERVSPSVLRRFSPFPAPAKKLGHARASYSFSTRGQALLAVAVERAHRRGTAEDVLRCLAGSLDRWVVHEGEEEWCPDSVVEPTEEATASCGTGAWRRVVGKVREAHRSGDGESTRFEACLLEMEDEEEGMARWGGDALSLLLRACSLAALRHRSRSDPPSATSSSSPPTTLREVRLAVASRREAAPPPPLSPGETEPLVLAMVRAGMDASRVDEAADDVAREFGAFSTSSLARALRCSLLAGATAEEVAECVVEELEEGVFPPVGGWTSKGAAVASASSWGVSSFVTSVDVVHAHWRYDAGEECLVHRVRGEYTLHFWPTAPCGGVFQLRCARWRRSERAERWPPWIGTALRRVDPRVVPSTASPVPAISSSKQGGGGGGKRPPPCVSTDVALAEAAKTHCKRSCAVLSQWERSHARSFDLAPVLPPDALLSLARDPDAWATKDGSLRAVRVRTMEEAVETGVFSVLEKRFHSQYATQAIHRTTADADAILCAAQDGEGKTVAAFAVVAYRCLLCDGTRSVALMVDSFAVRKDREGTGVGGRVFRELLVGAMGERHSPHAERRRRCVVFAQCLNTKDARQFWQDKLDDSGVARSLLLQAFALDGGKRVSVQSARECTPRAREWFLGGEERGEEGGEEGGEEEREEQARGEQQGLLSLTPPVDCI